MKFFIAICVLLIGTGNAAAKNESTTSSNLQLDVLGRSGKFKIRYVDDDNSTITVTMDAMYEVDSEDHLIRTTSPHKHGYKTFASQDFYVTRPEEVDYPGSNGATTDKIAFNATLDNGATLKIDTYLIKEDGSFTNKDNETVELRKDTLKWNFEVKHWPFCVNCIAPGNKQENGSFLDIKITVKGQGNANKIASSMDYELGGGAIIKLNNKVDLDDKPMLVNMPSRYPIHKKERANDAFTFRFPKFKFSAKHDPTLELGPSPSPTTGASSHAPLFVTVLLVTLIKAIAF